MFSPLLLDGCLQLEQLSLLSSLSIFVLSTKSRRIAHWFNRSGSQAGVGVGFYEDTGSLLLPQTRLVFSSSLTNTELLASCWFSGEAKSVFPGNGEHVSSTKEPAQGEISSPDDISLVSQLHIL